jgi:hypothetical protein
MVNLRCCFCHRLISQSNCRRRCRRALESELFRACLYRCLKNQTCEGEALYVCAVHIQSTFQLPQHLVNQHCKMRNEDLSTSNFKLVFRSAVKSTTLEKRQKEVFEFIEKCFHEQGVSCPFPSPFQHDSYLHECSAMSTSAKAFFTPASVANKTYDHETRAPIGAQTALTLTAASTDDSTSCSLLISSAVSRTTFSLSSHLPSNGSCISSPSVATPPMQPQSSKDHDTPHLQEDTTRFPVYHYISANQHSAFTGIALDEKRFILDWLRQCDFHNNFGTDFVDLSHDQDFHRCFHHMTSSNGLEFQSGTNSDDFTASNRLWEMIGHISQQLFKVPSAKPRVHHPTSGSQQACFSSSGSISFNELNDARPPNNFTIRKSRPKASVHTEIEENKEDIDEDTGKQCNVSGQETNNCAYYIPISLASHSSDLFQHMINVFTLASEHALITGDSNENGVKRRKKANQQRKKAHKATVIVFPNSYYTMGFSLPSVALLQGSTINLHILSTDASFECGVVDSSNPGPHSSPLSATSLSEIEEAAIIELTEELQNLVQASVSSRIVIVLVEPFLIPGKGRTYSAGFLKQVQIVCRESSAHLVADESLSFVRCGFPLMSLAIDDFLPDLVMIGKGLGSAMLLGCSHFIDALQERTGISVAFEFESGYSLLGAPLALLQVCKTLQIILEKDVARYCREEGEKLLSCLREVVGQNNVRGFGYCLWLTNDGLEQLPIMACHNGRILPRYDQCAATIHYILKYQKLAFTVAHAGGERLMAEARIFSCSRCGEPCQVHQSEQPGSISRCKTCNRQSHTRCVQAVKDHNCPCKKLFQSEDQNKFQQSIRNF